MSCYVDVKELKKIMIDQDVNTIAELSDKTGVNRNTLSDVLSGKSYPSADTMVKLTEGLNMDGSIAGKIFFAKKLTEYVSFE